MGALGSGAASIPVAARSRNPFMHQSPWAGLKSVAAVQGTFVRDGKVTTLTRYYITSRTLTADQLLEAVRGHWSIENSVHWVLDVVFGDDDQRLRSNYGPRNMALVQRIALNPDQAQALGQGPPHG